MNFFATFAKNISNMLETMGQVFYHTWYIILPIAFFYTFKYLWLDHVQRKFIISIEYVLLEIITPRDIEKSPKPIEALFSGISGVHKGFNVKEQYIQGMLTFKFSFEIVSDGGVVHFYIRTPKMHRNLIEANLYAQYPTIEIREVPDYTKNVPKLVPNKDWDLWGTDFELVKPDAYPIKTYLKFEETITGTMIDPLSSLIEVMGKVGPGQKIWYQLIVIPEAESWAKKGQELIDEKFKGKLKPKTTGEKILDGVMDMLGGILGKTSTHAESKNDQPIEFKLTPGEKEVLKALEANIGKSVYNVKMRFLYLGLKEGFDKTFVSAFVGAIKQFNDQNLNGFKPQEDSKTAVAYVMTESRMSFRQRKIFQRYVNRDPTGKKFILSSEELATIYHLPDMSVAAPSITRVEAKRGGAPSNLPIQG